MSDTTIDAQTARNHIENAYRQARHTVAETPEEKKLRRAAEQWRGADPQMEQAIELREKQPEKFDALPPEVHMSLGRYEAAREAHTAYEARDKTPKVPSVRWAQADLDHALEQRQLARAKAEAPDAPDSAARELDRATGEVQHARRVLDDALDAA